MYIFLIISGIVLITFGIVGLSSKHVGSNPDKIFTQDSITAHSSNDVIADISDTIEKPITVANLSNNSATSLSGEEKSIQSQSNFSDSEQKGFEFEKFVDSHFDSKYFNRLEWRSDIKGNDGRLSESSKYPDLEYEIRKGGYAFAVECKWRAKFFDGKVKFLSSEKQLDNYRQFAKDKNIDVIVVLGIGGLPDNPQKLYSIPLSEIADIEQTKEQLEKFRFLSIPNTFFYDISAHNIRLVSDF